ncbi:MAG: S66 peptidase family protein [Putridiphycobacter sp.]
MERRKFIRNTSLTAFSPFILSELNFDNNSIPQILPPKLKKGDTIALTAPAGAVFNSTAIDKIEKRLKDLGFKTLRGKTLFMQEGYLAGNDKLRADELNQFFADPYINGILTMRGGWGCARILDLLDYDLIQKHPKIIIGYSDITALLIAITKRTGLITFHGPVGYSSWRKFSTEQVLRTLVEGQKTKMQNPPEELSKLRTFTSGSSYGFLVGGNLTVLTSIIGTKYEPNWQNKILFLEETGEEPYRIDRMLWQLKLAGVFDQINGCVLGAFTKCEPEEPQKSFSLEEVFEQHFKAQKFPVYAGASFGHIIPKFTLPIGAKVKLDADEFYLELMEKVVR